MLEDVTNLVSNGGFEAGVQEGSPVGFPGNIYKAPPGTRQLAMDSYGVSTGTVAVLENRLPENKTSFVSNSIPHTFKNSVCIS